MFSYLHKQNVNDSVDVRSNMGLEIKEIPIADAAGSGPIFMNSNKDIDNDNNTEDSMKMPLCKLFGNNTEIIPKQHIKASRLKKRNIKDIMIKYDFSDY